MGIQVPKKEFFEGIKGVPGKEDKDGIHYWQEEVLDKFDNKEFRFGILKWHRRARKTSLAINILIKECMANPNHVYMYVAPFRTQAKGLVWMDPNMLFYWLPDYREGQWERYESDLMIKFKNGSLLYLKGADDPGNLRGYNCNGVIFDEFSLMKYTIWSLTFRPIMSEDKNRWALFLYTPRTNTFTIDMESKAMLEENKDWFYSYLPVSKSKLMDEDELVKARLDMTQSEYDQEYECSDLSAEQRILINPMLINELTKYVPQFHTERRIVAVDPASGGDEAVLYYFVNGEVRDELIVQERDTMILTGFIQEFCIKNKCNSVIIDNIGVGKGVYDRLRERKVDARTFQSAESANNKQRFANKRAEAWYTLMEKMERHEIPAFDDRELIKQFSCVGWKIVDSNGKVQIDSKSDIKKRLHASCDRADCFVYGIYGLDYVKEEGKDKRMINYNKRKRNNRGSFMSV